jgi:hypothetical protein
MDLCRGSITNTYTHSELSREEQVAFIVILIDKLFYVDRKDFISWVSWENLFAFKVCIVFDFTS